VQLLLPIGAAAHQLGPNYETVVRAITPPVPGLSVHVIKGKGELRLTNKGTKKVTVYGYSREPYLELLPGGRVLENNNSPAKYLNLDQYANTNVPSHATSKAKPDWREVSTDGTFEWHDHRIHWMSPVPPRSIVDVNKRKKIFDWKVPFEVGSRPGAVTGTLYWAGEPKAPPLASIAVFAISGLTVLIGGFIWWRRTAELDEDEVAPHKPDEREAW
jgi:hypothetical protein